MACHAEVVEQRRHPAPGGRVVVGAGLGERGLGQCGLLRGGAGEQRGHVQRVDPQAGQERAGERGGLGEERSGPVRVAARAQHAAPLEALADPRLGVGPGCRDLVEQGPRLVVPLLSPSARATWVRTTSASWPSASVSSARSRASEPAGSSKSHACSIAASTSSMSACCHFTKHEALSKSLHVIRSCKATDGGCHDREPHRARRVHRPVEGRQALPLADRSGRAVTGVHRLRHARADRLGRLVLDRPDRDPGRGAA